MLIPMNFEVGHILFFDRYQFTDTGETKPHFALVLLPERATEYQNSILCAVITSKEPKKWGLPLSKTAYSCLTRDSFVCFDRKDLVSKEGLGSDEQPKGKLTDGDFKPAFKLLKKSLFVVDDLGKSPYFRAAIIYQWKVALGMTTGLY
jgi:hypothetical protein